MGGTTASDALEPVDSQEAAAADPVTVSSGRGARWRSRALLLIGATTLGLLLLGAAWIAVTGLLARSQLQDVRAELPQLRRAVLAGQLSDARALADRIRTQADRAHALTTGPAWWVSSNLPAVGTPLRTTRVLASAADRLGGDVVPTVVDLATQVSAMRPTNSTVDLTRIEALAPRLHRAAGVAHGVADELRASDGSWLGAVSSARRSVLDQLTQVDGELTGADRAVRIAVPLLGGTTPQRYFIGFLNEAESRGVGGIPGAFAIATADHGRVRFDHFGSDTELRKVRARVDLGADFDALYARNDPTGTFPNSDLSPNFADAARIWAGLWRAKTGQRIDGAIAVDPTALGYLLAVTGPAHTADGQRIDAGNVVALTQRDEYRRYPSMSRRDTAARKAYVVRLAKAVSSQLTKGGDPHGLVRAVGRAAAERRFTVWSAQPTVQREIDTANWSGALGAGAGTPYSGFAVNNAAGNKLDYYLDRTLTYQRTGCGAAGTATATFRLTNGAPARGLPPYVTLRADSAPAGAHPGDNRLLVTYYASVGAHIRSITIDGRRVTGAPGVENGHPVVVLDVELPRGVTRTISVQVDEPAADQPVTVLRQPLVRPVQVRLEGDRCGG